MAVMKLMGSRLKGAGSHVRPQDNVVCVEACGWGESTTATEMIFGGKVYRRAS